MSSHATRPTMRTHLVTTSSVLLSTPLLFLGGAGELPGSPVPPPLSFPDGACATGCSAISTEVDPLTAAEYGDLLRAFALEPLDEQSPALETLLFHGPRTRDLVDSQGLGLLDPARSTLLREELTRTHAWIDVRLVDENGVERMHLGRQRIPFGEKQHLFPDRTRDLQPPEISGTVQRVGLKHLWARL